MGLGSYTGFETLDRISNFENEKDRLNPVYILVKMANESFESESSFYKKIGLDKYCTSAGQVTKLLKNSSTFDEYQRDLSKQVYGFEHKEQSFLKYFYDSSFIKSLSAQSSGNNLLNNLAKELREYYKTIRQEEKQGKQKSSDIVLDNDFFEEFKNNTTNFSELTPKNVQTAVVDYILKKRYNKTSGIENEGKVRRGIAAEYKSVIAQIKNFIDDKEKTGKGGQGFLQLAELHFMDEGRITIDDQLNKMVEKIIQFLSNKIGAESDELTVAIKNEVFNNLQYEVGLALSAGEQRTIEYNNNTYLFSRQATKEKNSSKTFKKANQSTFLLTYPEIKKLADTNQGKTQFLLPEIQLLGGEDVFKKIFTPEIKNKISEIMAKSNPSYTLTSSDIDEINAISQEAYIDKNSFFKEMSKLKLNYIIYSDEEQGRKSSTLKDDIDIICKIFYQTLYNALGNSLIVKDLNSQKDFSDWWKKKGESSFKKMIDSNPAQIYEIVSKSSEANVAGMLGETLMALFLTNLNIDSSLVQILGQTTHGNGQAAVDLKILFKENENILKSVGFQIKQYASKEASGKTDLYGDTSLLLNSVYMRRYLETKYLEQIRSIFFNKQDSSFWLNSNGIQDNAIENVNNILNSHLIYFIRYDEAQMKGENIVSTEQNNFYIINFRFIPASTLFILAAIALADQINKEMNSRYDFFYFTDNPEIMKNQNNIMMSLVNYLELDATKEARKNNNLCSFMQNDLRLHFRGFKVNFSDQLNSVIKNTQR